jgi:hypothetical protein
MERLSHLRSLSEEMTLYLLDLAISSLKKKPKNLQAKATQEIISIIGLINHQK